MLLLLGGFGLLAPLPGWARSAATVFLVVACLAVAAALLLRPRPGAAVPARGAALLAWKIRSGLAAAGQPRVLALSAAAALAGWLMEVAISFYALAAFGLPATAQLAVLVTLATTLSSAISISPGNAGVFEASVVLALAGAGVAAEPALAFALGYHAVHLVPVALVGGVFALQTGYKGALVRNAS
jgi:uncharacterized membrane protein YbhN (UPF0104 family)